LILYTSYKCIGLANKFVRFLFWYRFISIHFFCSRRHCVILLRIWKVMLNITFLWILIWLTLVLCMLR